MTIVVMMVLLNIQYRNIEVSSAGYCGICTSVITSTRLQIPIGLYLGLRVGSPRKSRANHAEKEPPLLLLLEPLLYMVYFLASKYFFLPRCFKSQSRALRLNRSNKSSNGFVLVIPLLCGFFHFFVHPSGPRLAAPRLVKAS